MERLVGSAGFPCWWHRGHDRQIDFDVWCSTRGRRLLCVAVARCYRSITRAAEPAQRAALQAAAGVRCSRPALQCALGDGWARPPPWTRSFRHAQAARQAINRALMRLSRILVPLAYTSGDRFTHDLALPIPPLAGLQRARELARLDPDGDEYKFARAALVRERNRAVHALDSAVSVADELMALEDRR
jgi:hypothetical protein